MAANVHFGRPLGSIWSSQKAASHFWEGGGTPTDPARNSSREDFLLTALLITRYHFCSNLGLRVWFCRPRLWHLEYKGFFFGFPWICNLKADPGHGFGEHLLVVGRLWRAWRVWMGRHRDMGLYIRFKSNLGEHPSPRRARDKQCLEAQRTGLGQFFGVCQAGEVRAPVLVV